MDFFKDFCFGKLNTYERIIQPDGCYQQMLRMFQEEEEAFKKRIGKQNHIQYNEIKLLNDNIKEERIFHAFRVGFTLGLMFTKDSESCLSEIKQAIN